jgi:ABC-type antimicrobial peptide transport system permease subunit
LVLLIACVNVANLGLVRSTQRARELAVRVALGASRINLIRYSLAESFLSLAGTIAGCILSRWITELAISRVPRLARTDESLLFRVSVFDPVTFLVTPLVLILAASVPCWLIARKASRIDPMDALRLE